MPRPAHLLAADDRRFRDDFEAGIVRPDDFSHRAHVRLAYIYLAESDDVIATERMRASLLAFLRHHGIPREKYHETMTSAWILAVRHFMERSAACESADAFIDANPTLLDSKIMLSHYSAGVLFSAEARAAFIPPDVQSIPRH